MAFAITRRARLMASMSFFNLGAHLFGHMLGALRVLCINLVHLIHFKLGALAAICVLARRVACLDGWVILARLHHGRFRALVVAGGIGTALLMASMNLLHHLMHVVPVSMLTMMGPMSVLIMMGPLSVPTVMEH